MVLSFSCLGFSQANFVANTIGTPGNGPLPDNCPVCTDGIRLTSTQTNSNVEGSAYWHNQTLDFTQDFTMTFSIRFSDITQADGITFTIHDLGTNFTGGGGGNLGIYDGIATHQAIVAEFDIWNNGTAWPDIPADHFAVSSSTSRTNNVLVAPIPIALQNNCWHNVLVIWACNQLTYFLDGQVLATLNAQDVMNAFGGMLPMNANFGFTAGVASRSNDQDVCFQAFVQTPSPTITCEDEVLVNCGDSFDFNTVENCCGDGFIGHWKDQDGQTIENGILNNIEEPGIYTRQTASVDDCVVCTQIVKITVLTPAYEIILTPSDADIVLGDGSDCCLGISIDALIEIISAKTQGACEFSFEDFPDEFEEWPVPPPSNDVLLMCAGNSYYVESGCCIVEFNVTCQKVKGVKGAKVSPGSVIERIDASSYGGKSFIKQKDNTALRSMGFGYEGSEFDLSIHPNPTNGTVQISGSGSKDIIDIVLFDEKGSMIELKKEFRNGESLDLSDLPTGLYFVKFLNSDNKSAVKKIVISK